VSVHAVAAAISFVPDGVSSMISCRRSLGCTRRVTRVARSRDAISLSHRRWLDLFEDR